MSWDLSQFHFIRPLWLLAIPAMLMLWLLLSRALKTTYWEAHLNKEILEALRVNTSKQSSLGRWLLLLGWVVSAIAVAGPTWQKQPVPSFQNNSAMVIVLDLSVSMLAEDLTPNRLTQAKYKLIDILRARSDGQTALIAYSGDAHTVTPLTDDPNAIEALLPALHPNIMPIRGSNTEAAIELAMQLLKDTGNSSGNILLITDGVAEAAQTRIIQTLDRSYSLSILGVGSNEATPIPLETGGFLRSSGGEIILSTLDNQQLAELAAQSNGRYRQIQINDSDISYLIDDEFEASQTNDTGNMGNTTLYDHWVDMGHWLVILLLPLAALCFRKGVIYLLPLFFMLPPDSNAFEWQDLWQTKDQQAQQLLAENPADAAATFERDDWSGVANYQAKNYAAAAEKFSTGDTATDHYNRGNALALSGNLPEAIEAYSQALELDTDYANAQANKETVEKILEQQDQQQQEKQDQEGDENQENSENSQEQDSEESESESESESEQSSDDSQKQASDQSSEEQSQDQSEQQKQEQAEQENNEQTDAQDESEENNEQPSDSEPSDEEAQEQPNDEEASAMLGEATPEQLEDASEQWLRGIQDDPSGLLRRKFRYQSQLRSQQRAPTQPNSGDERY